MFPEGAPTAEPELNVIAPESTVLATPDTTVREPLVKAAPVATYIDPEFETLLLPDMTEIEPPVPAEAYPPSRRSRPPGFVAFEEAPATTDRAPP